MFHQQRVLAALAAKADRFSGYEARIRDVLLAYQSALETLEGLSCEEIEAALAGVVWPGAKPTFEHDAYPDLVVPFAHDWESHQQARDWARETLLGIPTVAVDGSQITPTKTLSIPVGAVQIGWFINPHDPGADYVKDLVFEVLAPDELSDEDAGNMDFPDWRVNLRRFTGECERLIDLMEGYRGSPLDERPVCFFDGSLILSFAQQMQPARQRLYVGAILSLLDASEDIGIPLVGYVDTSYANDLVSMLDALTGRSISDRISDGAILRSRHMQWGDRSTAWVCARNDDLEPVGGRKYYDRVVLVYLQTTADRPPVRLDIPRWVLDVGILDRVVDIVRAECVVGNGYPYAVETADAVAVITLRDRERFYRVFQAFAEQQGLGLRFSRKAVSKVGRRV
jgi:hypothetical protein